MMEEILLEIKDATIRYRQDILFNDLNFKINRGEHWAIVGESGSGKSALLQTLAGKHIIAHGIMLNHYYDEFLRKNEVNDPYFTHHDLISYVDIKHEFRNLSNTNDFYYQQRYNAWDSDDAPTVDEFLLEADTKAASGKIWTVDAVYEKLRLRGLKEKQLIKLSNGESKRLRIATALLKNPLFLMLDNPLTGLDVETRARFSDLFNEISKTGITIVMVTSPHEIPSVITHVAVLDRKRKMKTFQRPAFVPSLLKETPLTIPSIEQLKPLIRKTNEHNFEVTVDMQNVSVKYGDNVILQEVNWNIKQGEKWALSGPNGSGKSTLLSLINGDHPQAYANEITLFDCKRGTGESIWDIKSKIGFMSPELYQYFPLDFICRHVVESGLYDTLGLLKESKEEDRELALEWLALLELENISELKLRDVSASKQRLCLLARALIKNPYLLILDEPCQGLDLHQQNHFRQLIDQISTISNFSLIYVTHYQEELPSCIEKTFMLPAPTQASC